MNKMLITSAGLAEIVNAEQSGTAPVVLSHVAFGTGQYTPTADMTAYVRRWMIQGHRWSVEEIRLVQR